MQPQYRPSFMILLLLMSFPSVNAVLYTPALPAIGEYFNVSKDAAQQTITIFLFGYAFGQLLYGPIANRYGRIPAIFAGCALQIVSSLACIAAARWNTFELFYAARFFAAMGSGVGLKITFTLVNEYYAPKIARQKIAYLILIFAIAPGLSTALGGLITEYADWVVCFYFLAVYGLIVMLFASKLPETKYILDYQAFELKHLYQGYADQFQVTQLVTAGVLMGTSTTVIYLFASLSPFIAINHFGMSSAEYGFANLLPSIAMLVGGVTSAKLVKRVPLISVASLGAPLWVVGILLLSIGLALGWPPILALFVPFMIIFVGNSLLYGNTSSIGLQATHDKAHGSAVMNFINMGISAVAVLSLSLHHFPALYVLPIMSALFCMLMLWSLFKLRGIVTNDDDD